MRILRAENARRCRGVKDLEVVKEAKEVKDVKENARAVQWRVSCAGRADWSLANTRGG